MTSVENETSTDAPTVKLVRMRRRSTELEEVVVRERLASARLMNGFSPAQAQERFGDERRNIWLIETGKQPLPKDYEFLTKAAQAYSVSLDFLLGVTPNPENDAVFSERYALMRGFESILAEQAKATTAAFFGYAQKQDKLCKQQCQSLVDAVDAVHSAVEVMRKYGFDELRGSARVLSAFEGLEKAIQPVRKVLAAQRETEAYCKDLALGKVGPIAYLTDEYWASDGNLSSQGR